MTAPEQRGRSEPSEDELPVNGEKPEAELPEGEGIQEGAVSTAMAQAFQILSSILIGSIVGRSLGPVGKGALTAMRTLAQMLLQFGGMGVVRSSLYLLGKRRCSLRQATGTFVPLFVIGMLLGCLVTSLLYALDVEEVRRMLSATDPEHPDLVVLEPGTGLLLFWILALAMGLSHVLRGLLQGLARLRWINRAEILGGLSTLLGLCILALAGQLTVQRAIVVTIVSQLLLVALAWKWLRSIQVGRSTFHLGTLRASARYGIPVWFGEITRFLFVRVDLVIVAGVLGPAELGPYSVAYALMEMIFFAPRALGIASYRQITGSTDEEGLELNRKIAHASIFGASFATLGLAIFAWPFTYILYGPPFLSAIPLFFILLPGAWLRSGLCWYESYIHGTRGKPLVDTALQATGSILKVGLSFLFLEGMQLGSSGVALAASVSNALQVLLVVWTTHKLSGRSMRYLCIPERSTLVRVLRQGFELVSKFLSFFVRRRLLPGEVDRSRMLVLVSPEAAEAQKQFLVALLDCSRRKGIGAECLVLGNAAVAGFSALGAKGGPFGLRIVKYLSTRPELRRIHALGAGASSAALCASHLVPSLRVMVGPDRGLAAGPLKALAEAWQGYLLDAAAECIAVSKESAERMRDLELLAEERVQFKEELDAEEITSDWLARMQLVPKPSGEGSESE